MALSDPSTDDDPALGEQIAADAPTTDIAIEVLMALFIAAAIFALAYWEGSGTGSAWAVSAIGAALMVIAIRRGFRR